MRTELPHSILIVDNDASVVEALTARLGGMGYRCASACSGAQAIARFQADVVDLVISDLNMPQGDGESLAQNLRRISDVPLVIISGFKDADRRTLVGMPDVWFLSKPFESAELVGLVEKVLEGRAPARDCAPQRC